MKIKVKFKDGNLETFIADDAYVDDGCLILFTRFGGDAGSKYIPLKQIKWYEYN